MAFRYDIGEISGPIRMRDGRLLTTGRITRSGVFHYLMPDGSVRKEYRAPEEVFSERSLNTYRLAPVTDDHPKEVLSADNARKYAVGATGDSVRQEGNYVVAPIAVYDTNTISKMESGKNELSAGYEVDIILKSGVSPDGEEYDARQTNIHVNHVAIVDRARAGPNARVRMDDAAVMIQDADEPKIQQEPSQQSSEERMDELTKALKEAAEARARADALQKDLDAANKHESRADTAEQRADEEKARADKAEKERDEEKARADKAEGERDSEKSRADEAEKEKKEALDSVGQLVKSRVALETSASAVLAKDIEEDKVKLDGMTDREVHIAVIQKIDGGEIDKEASDEYIVGRFDSVVARVRNSKDSHDELRSALEQNKDDINEDEEAKAMRENAEKSRNAWKEQK